MKRFVFLGAAALLATALIVAGRESAQAQQDSVTDKIAKALPDTAPAKPKQPRKILIFSKTAGFRHASIPVGIKAITMLGDKTGAYSAYATENEGMFEPAKLKAFDAVVMLNTTGDCLRPKEGTKEEQTKREEMLKQSLVAFVADGKGLVGMHAGGDTYRDWSTYNAMMGGAFEAHPWNIVKTPVKNLEPANPVNAAFGGQDFQIEDEIYVFRPSTALSSDRKMLLCIDTTKMDVSKPALGKGKRPDGFYPISWLANFGKGRNFYCSLGHKDEIYWNPVVLKHYLAGIQYALGDLDADATPTGRVPQLKK